MELGPPWDSLPHHCLGTAKLSVLRSDNYMESILSHKVGGGWGTAICANEHPTDPCGPNSVRTKYQPQVLCNRSATHGRGAKLKGEVKAIRVPRGGNDKISPQVFSFCTEIRHVVESGVKIVGEAAWEAVNSANRPLARQSSAITWRRQTPRVVAPGCKHFGLKYSKSVAPQRGWIRLNAQQSASLPSPSEVSSFSSMHSSESHQFRHARAGCSAPKPMLAGLLFSGGGHCRTCLADRLQQDRLRRLCELPTAANC